MVRAVLRLQWNRGGQEGSRPSNYDQSKDLRAIEQSTSPDETIHQDLCGPRGCDQVKPQAEAPDYRRAF